MFRYCIGTLVFIISLIQPLTAAATDPVAIIIDDLVSHTRQEIYFSGGTTFQVVDEQEQNLEPIVSIPGFVEYAGDLMLNVPYFNLPV